MIALTTTDLNLSEAALTKFTQIFSEIEDDVEGIRIFAQPGGCSGISFGMGVEEKIADNDLVRDHDAFKVIVDEGTIPHLRGAEIDFVNKGNGEESFVFNNLPKPAGGGGCGTCGSATSCGSSN